MLINNDSYVCDYTVQCAVHFAKLISLLTLGSYKFTHTTDLNNNSTSQKIANTGHY